MKIFVKFSKSLHDLQHLVFRIDQSGDPDMMRARCLLEPGAWYNDNAGRIERLKAIELVRRESLFLRGLDGTLAEVDARE